LELVGGRIRNAFGFDPIDDVQILTPMDRGLVGTANLNVELQKALNPREDGVTRGGRNFRVDDKVMQIRNNYDKEVFNGDIGRIIRIDTLYTATTEPLVHRVHEGKEIGNRGWEQEGFGNRGEKRQDPEAVYLVGQ
jgi:ATP-dependent exoDNAse (exonuclease V) alpha subunit